MSPTNVVTSSSPRSRSRLKSRKSSGVTKSPKSPATKLSDKTTSLQLESPTQINDGKGQVRYNPSKRGNQFDSPTRDSPSLYFDDYNSSPSHIPNSQAPIPGREVYWDHDTPESKRIREQYEREFQQMSPEAASAPIHTPTIKMVPIMRTRRVSKPTIESVEEGEKILADLESLNKQVQERIERDKKLENNENNGTSLTEGNVDGVTDSPGSDQVFQGVNNNKVSSNLAVINEENDMFGDGEDIFDDDDEDLLLQATQAVEEEGGGETKPFTASSFIPEVISMKLQCTPPRVSSNKNSYNFSQPRLAAVKNEGFDDVNDSFDDYVSQLDEPTAELPPTRQITVEPSNKPSSVLYQAKHPSKPIVSKQSASSFNFKPSTVTSSSVSVTPSTKQSKLPHPRLESCKNDGFDSGNDSFDEAMSQVVFPASTSAFKPEDSVFDNTETSPVLKKARMAYDFKSTKTSDNSKQSNTRNNSFGRKFNSFDSPPKEKKLIAKFRSDSQIPKAKMCSKEEIERKRKEALARRNASLSQKKKY